MYTSLLEVEHEGGSDNESCIEVENDDLISELLHNVVWVRLHQQITAVHLRRLGTACCGIFFHQRFKDLQREWGLTVLLHPDPRSERLCGGTPPPNSTVHIYLREGTICDAIVSQRYMAICIPCFIANSQHPNTAFGAFFPIGKCTIMPTSACPITS